MRYVRSIFLVALIALTIVAAVVAIRPPAPAESAPVPPRVTEDDPRWSCETQGNRVCGPVSAGADSEGVTILDGSGVPLAFVPWENVADCDTISNPETIPACRVLGYGIG
jgi:hypothetical protein